MSGLNKAIIYKTDTGKTWILKYDDTLIVNPEQEPSVVPNLDLSHEFGIGPGGSGDDTYCGWYIFAIDADTGEYYELKQEEWDVQITLTNTQGEMYQLTENDYRFGDYWNDDFKNEITVFFPSRQFDNPYSTYQMEAKLISKIDSSKVFTSIGEPTQITENFTMLSSRSVDVYAEPEYNDNKSSCLVKVSTYFDLCNILGNWRFELRPTNGDIIQITDFVVSEDGENRVNYGTKDFTFGPYTFEDNGSINFELYMISPNGTEYFIGNDSTEIECKDTIPNYISLDTYTDYNPNEIVVNYTILNSQGEELDDVSNYTIKVTSDKDTDTKILTEPQSNFTCYLSDVKQKITVTIYDEYNDVVTENSVDIDPFEVNITDNSEFNDNDGTQYVDLSSDNEYAEIIFGYNNTQD